MGNPFVHFELSADDVGAARKFYGKIFDWKIGKADPRMGGYAMIDLGKRDSAAGLTKKMMPDQPTGWLSYVEVSSVEKTLEKAMRAGATVVLPCQEIAGMGAIGIFMDPQGAALGIWEPAKRTKKPAKRATAKPKAARSKAARSKTARSKTARSKAAKSKTAKR